MNNIPVWLPCLWSWFSPLFQYDCLICGLGNLFYSNMTALSVVLVISSILSMYWMLICADFFFTISIFLMAMPFHTTFVHFYRPIRCYPSLFLEPTIVCSAMMSVDEWSSFTGIVRLCGGEFRSKTMLQEYTPVSFSELYYNLIGMYAGCINVLLY